MRIHIPGKYKVSNVDSSKSDSSPSNSVVLTGSQNEKFSISVLEEDIFRVVHYPEGVARNNKTWIVAGSDSSCTLEGKERNDYSAFNCPEFKIEGGDQLRLRTSKLNVVAELNPLRLIWRDAEDNCIAEDLTERAYCYDLKTESVFHYMTRSPEMRFYGFGEKSGALNKHGRRMRMFNLDAGRYNAELSDPLYKHFPFYITFLPQYNTAYGLLYDNLATTVFDMGCEHHNFLPAYRYYEVENGDLDYYFLYGPSIEQVLEKLAKLTGYMTMPPRWSLGYLGSTMHYTDADNAQEELAKFPKLCQEHEIPCDLFHLSSGYTAGDDGKRYVFNWNQNRIPDAGEMVDSFHRHSIKLTANVKPCLLKTHPRYEEVKAFGGFVKRSDGNSEQIDKFWDGDGAHLDFTNSNAFKWWQENLEQQLFHYGIDSVWNDNNEYAIWDDEAIYDGFGSPIRISVWGRALQSLLMAKASFEALQRFKPEQRPYVITRSGCPGIQKYAQTWTGDNDSNWHTLKFNIPMGLGLSLSGVPNIGHDVGGFFGTKPEPELFVRWIQNGIFHPRFTIHSWHDDGSVNEPWMYPEVLPIIREQIKFRYSIIPFLYSLLALSSETGQPVIRPLVYEFSTDSNCYDQSFDFLLGPDWLIASVWQSGLRDRQVYLPEGVSWCNFHSGQWYQGGETVIAQAPLQYIPSFVREGGMIPIGKAEKITDHRQDTVRKVLAFPHPKDKAFSKFELIEDDGISLDYQKGKRTRLELSLECSSTTIKPVISYKQRGYQLPYQEIEFIFPRNEDRKVSNARKVWQDENGLVHAIVSI